MYEDFEIVAFDLLEHILMDGKRFGVEPKERNPEKRKRTKKLK